MSNASRTLVTTPNVQRVRELMDSALESVDPLELRFTVERFGSLVAAKEAATSLQVQVSSIRVRARNSRQAQANRRNAEYTGEQIPGPYDALACNKRVLPDDGGYVVIIGHNPPDEFEVYNHRTGERLMFESPELKRRNVLGMAFIDRLSRTPSGQSPLTTEQERELHALDPVYFKNLFEASGVRLPGWFTAEEAVHTLAATDGFDLLDTEIGDFGVGPGEDDA